MVEKKITRKVISKVSVEEKVSKEEELKTPDSVGTKVSKVEEAGKPKKVCLFCQNKIAPSYSDTSTLRRFITDRAKIVPKAKSNLCSKHQRRVSREIKYARHLSLLPFTPKI